MSNMKQAEAKQILDKIIGQIFGIQNPFTFEQSISKFAFDVNLPQQVYDSTDGTPTWTMSTGPTKFISFDNVKKRNPIDDWVLPKRPLKNMQDIIKAWSETNMMAAERITESDNVGESDNVTMSQNVFRSRDIHESKNIILCDGIMKSEFVAASQRSINIGFCMRTDDSKNCSNSFSVNWSGKISDSLFIQDSYDLADCMFCSHMVSKRYCIANMQFEKEEYMRLRKIVIDWIFNG